MMSRAKNTKVVLGLTLLTSVMSISACATANDAPSAVDAIWLNTQDGPTRQAIRVFIREQSGPALIANPESLSKSPVLVNHRRQTRGSSVSRRDFKPSGEYRLMMDGNNQCWLIHTLQDVVTPLALPASASCTPYVAP